MNRLLSPLCLLLALALLVAGFALLATEPPAESIQLHQARVTGDERTEKVLQAHHRQLMWVRKALLVCLFVGSGMMTVVAFLTMRPSHPN